MLSSVVEDDYDGPRLSPDGITKDFVEEVIERFKDQKKIHKKYAYKVPFWFCLHINIESLLKCDIVIKKVVDVHHHGEVQNNYYDNYNIYLIREHFVIQLIMKISKIKL